MKRKPEIVDTILDSADSLFNEQGYCPVSLELVAERAEVSKRTLYKYFGDKNGLVSQVLLRRDVFFKESLTDVIAVFTENKDKINAIISWHIRWFHDAKYRGCMFIRAQAEYGNKNEQICCLVKEHKRWIQRFIYQCLGGTPSCEGASSLIMLILEGMITHTAIFGVDDQNFACEKMYIYDIIDNINESSNSGRKD